MNNTRNIGSLSSAKDEDVARARSISVLRTLATAMLFAAGVVLAAPAAAKTYIVVVNKMNFGPVPPRAPVEDTVQWVNKDIFKQSATALDGSFDVDLSPGKSGRTVMRRTGIIKFSSKYHPGMKSQLAVIK